MEPIKRVEVKLLEGELDSLRRKLILHKNASFINEELLLGFSETRPDTEIEQLINATANKQQIFLQLGSGLDESKKIIEQLEQGFKQFKSISHLKSIAECGEIIFEMRRLKAAYNIYMSFKEDQEKLTNNYNQLGERISQKVSDFMAKIQSVHNHVKEQQGLIFRDLRNQLTQGAYRIGWMNLDNCTRRYIRAQANKCGLQHHLHLTLVQHRRLEEQDITKSSLKSVDSKEDMKAVTDQINEIGKLRKQISNVTKEISRIKRGRRNKQYKKAVKLIISCDNRVLIDFSPEIEMIHNELEQEKKILHDTKHRYHSMRKEFLDMMRTKNEIYKLCFMIMNFRERPSHVLDEATENLFKDRELSHFLDNIYDLARKPLLEEPRETVPAMEMSHMFRVGSKTTIDTDMITSRKSLVLSMPSSYGTSAVSSANSRMGSPVVDVEEDFEDLNFIYEIQKAEEDEPDDNISDYEPSYNESFEF